MYPPPHPNSVLICDLDGTLVDSAPDLCRALNKLLYELGLPAQPLAAVTTMIGDGVAKLVARGLAASGRRESTQELKLFVDRFLAHYHDGLVIDTLPYPRSRDVLAALKSRGWRLAICTNKPEEPSRKILDALALAPLFEALAGGDSYQVRKPHPDHLLILLRAMGADPRNAIMLGDGDADARSAQAAGLPVIIARFGYGHTPPEELGADGAIDHFDELPGALATIAARPRPVA
jgi:phosphoglycolate phosphatase